jgi:hypothetical protein
VGLAFEVWVLRSGLGPAFEVASHVRGWVPCSRLSPAFEVGSAGSRVQGSGDFDGNLVRGSTESSLMGSVVHGLVNRNLE